MAAQRRGHADEYCSVTRRGLSSIRLDSLRGVGVLGPASTDDAFGPCPVLDVELVLGLLSADNMRLYLKTGERERARLAQSLRKCRQGLPTDRRVCCRRLGERHPSCWAARTVISRAHGAWPFFVGRPGIGASSSSALAISSAYSTLMDCSCVMASHLPIAARLLVIV